jgi:hypothetical protein
MSWNFGFWFLSGVGAFIAGFEALAALRTGTVFCGRGNAKRDQRPIMFWLATTLYGIVTVACCWPFAFHYVASRERVAYSVESTQRAFTPERGSSHQT